MAEFEVTIRPAEEGDFDSWLVMWQAYCEFYGEAVADKVSRATWRRALDPGQPIHCLIAVDDAGYAVGFAVYVTHACTWSTGDVGYLEDIFVAPEARCRGVARQLIEHLRNFGRSAGWFRLYWHTERGNHAARSLYDKLTDGATMVRYEIRL